MFESLVTLERKYRVPWIVMKYLSPQASSPPATKIMDKKSSPHPTQRNFISSPSKKAVSSTTRKIHFPNNRAESEIAAHGIPHRIDIKKYKPRRLFIEPIIQVFDGIILIAELCISPREIHRRDIIVTRVAAVQVTQLEFCGCLRNFEVPFLALGV